MNMDSPRAEPINAEASKGFPEGWAVTPLLDGTWQATKKGPDGQWERRAYSKRDVLLDIVREAERGWAEAEAETRAQAERERQTPGPFGGPS